MKDIKINQKPSFFNVFCSKIAKFGVKLTVLCIFCMYLSGCCKRTTEIYILTSPEDKPLLENILKSAMKEKGKVLIVNE